MKIERYVPKIVEVQVVRFLGETVTEQERVAEWCNGKLCGTQLHHQDRTIEFHEQFTDAYIEADYGDYIVKRDDGFSVFKPLQFEELFTPAGRW